MSPDRLQVRANGTVAPTAPPRTQEPTPRADPGRGRGIGLLHRLHTAENEYAAHRIAHLERRHHELANIASDQADEIARLRALLNPPCQHPRRDFNHGWYTCVTCGDDLYRA